MPLHELLYRGLRIGLGSDVGGGPTLSAFEIMHSAIYTHTARRLLRDVDGGDIFPATAFHLATLGGAMALGLDDKIGSLTRGNEADYVVANSQRLSSLPAEKWVDIAPDTLLSRLIFRGDDRIVEQTHVHGAFCYDRGSHDNNELAA